MGGFVLIAILGFSTSQSGATSVVVPGFETYDLCAKALEGLKTAPMMSGNAKLLSGFCQPQSTTAAARMPK